MEAVLTPQCRRSAWHRLGSAQRWHSPGSAQSAQRRSSPTGRGGLGAAEGPPLAWCLTPQGSRGLTLGRPGPYKTASRSVHELCNPGDKRSTVLSTLTGHSFCFKATLGEQTNTLNHQVRHCPLRQGKGVPSSLVPPVWPKEKPICTHVQQSTCLNNQKTPSHPFIQVQSLPR